MENIDYRVLIERMELRENVIDHIANILDMLLPIWGGRILHIGPGNWPHEEDLGVRRSRIGWTKWRNNTQISIQSSNATLRIRLSLVRVRFQHLLGRLLAPQDLPCGLQ